MIKSILACLLFAGCALAQAPQPVSLASSSERSNLIALERMWNQAQVSRDAPAIAGMIGDKFVNTEHPPASTLVVVKRLVQEEYLIEVEAIAGELTSV
jgi:hypothetical protein